MFLLSLYWFFISLLFALVEIEIEGKYGWSEKSQTWHLPSPQQPKIIAWLMGGKILTGYHLFLFPLAFLLTHAHFFMGEQLTYITELKTLAIYFSWTPLWDYLWIVWNPYYGISKIRTIKWYKDEKIYFNFFTLSSITQWGLSLLFAISTVFIAHTYIHLLNHLIFMGNLILFSVIISTLFVPFYRRWYKQMRKNT